MRFKGKTVLVTGAGSGIGMAAAQQFMAEGATVIATGRNLDKLEAIPTGGKGKLLCRVSNAGDPTAIAELAFWIEDECGALDVLVNNAGFNYMNNPEDVEESGYQVQMDVLVKGPVFYVKHLAPLLRASDNGSVVNISSVAALVSSHGYCPYGLAKAALNKFTEDCVVQVPGIRHNNILPGFIETPILDGAYGEGASEQLAAVVAALEPIGRMGRPEEVASAILFLASDEARYINGASLVIDGGVSRLHTVVSALSGQVNLGTP